MLNQHVCQQEASQGMLMWVKTETEAHGFIQYIIPSYLFPSKGIISGWGTTSSGGSQPNELQWATVTIWENSVGTAAYGTIAAASFPASVDGSIDSCQVGNNIFIHFYKVSKDIYHRVTLEDHWFLLMAIAMNYMVSFHTVKGVLIQDFQEFMLTSGKWRIGSSVLWGMVNVLASI